MTRKPGLGFGTGGFAMSCQDETVPQCQKRSDSITPYPCIWYLECCCPLWFSLVAGMPIPKPSSAASSAGSSSSPCKAKPNVGEVLRLRLRVAKTFFCLSRIGDGALKFCEYSSHRHSCRSIPQTQADADHS
jgi:hypothetical protein